MVNSPDTPEFCGTCGSKVEDNAVYCGNCGSRQGAVPVPSTESSTPASPLSDTGASGVERAESVVCQHCYAKNSPQNENCTLCGNPLPASPAANTIVVNESRLATPCQRGWAYLIDATLIGIVSSPIVVGVFAPLPMLITSSFLTFIFIVFAVVVVVAIVYDVALTWKFGKTIGKAIVGIEVVQQDGETQKLPVLVWRALAKWILLSIPYLSALVFLVLVGMLLFREDRRLIHDLLAKTDVVKSSSRIAV